MLHSIAALHRLRFPGMVAYEIISQSVIACLARSYLFDKSDFVTKLKDHVEDADNHICFSFEGSEYTWQLLFEAIRFQQVQANDLRRSQQIADRLFATSFAGSSRENAISRSENAELAAALSASGISDDLSQVAIEKIDAESLLLELKTVPAQFLLGSCFFVTPLITPFVLFFNKLFSADMVTTSLC